jgi:hypothetical protein
LVSTAEECSSVRNKFGSDGFSIAEYLEKKVIPSLNLIRKDSEKHKEITDTGAKKKLDIPKLESEIE